MAPWWVCGLLPLLAVAAAAAAAAEGNAEPLIRSPAQDQQDAAPAPAPSAEDRVTRRVVLVAGYSCYHHQADLCTSSCLCRAYQILMRREMNEERIVVCMGKDMARNPQNPRRGVIITAEENTEPLILLPTQNEHDAAPAPAPSVKDSSGYENYRHQILKRGGLKEGVTRWAVLVAGSSGYKNYGHQADVCHAYQILKRGGLKEETILVCMYDDDDLAKTPQNPRPGVIIIAEENTEPLILLATQNEHVAAPAPSAEERITRADPSGYGNYHHQILKRGGMNEERIMVCMYDAIAKNFQNPRPGVIVAAEENTEPLHDAAAAPAPSAEEGATTKRAVLVAGSYGYKSYRRQVMDSTVEPEADHADLFDKTGLVMAGCLVIGGALVTLGIVFVYRVYRFITLEKQLRRRKLPFSLYPPKGTTYPAGDGHTVCAVCLSRFGWCACIAVLPACGHIFHCRCLRAEVALESPRCPMCRAAVA